nr:hypothetical protein [Candidatus Sigynarchaeota archaeon]
TTNLVDVQMAFSNIGFVVQQNRTILREFIQKMESFGLIAPLGDINEYLGSFYNTTWLNETIL